MTYQIYCVNIEHTVQLSEACAGFSGQTSKDRSYCADLSSRLFLAVWNLGTVHPVTPLLCLQCPIPEHRLMVTLAWSPEPPWLFRSSGACRCPVGQFPRLLSVPVVWPQPAVAEIFPSRLCSCCLLPLNPSVVPSSSENTAPVVCNAVLTCYPASTPIDFLIVLSSAHENPHSL